MNMDDPSVSTMAHADEELEIAAFSELFNIYTEAKPLTSRFVYCPLPTEILEAIFILCACTCHSENRGEPTPTPPSWVNVSYVCHQWRDVALSCAPLWTYLFNTSPRWTEELLSRSKQASLKLNVNLLHRNGNHERARFFEQVIHNSERIQDFRLYIFRPDYDVFLSKLSPRAPLLEHLQILIEGFSTDSSSPSLLFDGDTPALRTLELLDCPVPWYSLKLTALTKLKLRHIPVQCQQSTPDFLATLRCMPNLQHLGLHNSLASATGFLSGVAFHSFQKISLPHLSRLLINAPVSTVIALLSCTNIPSEAQVDLGPDRFTGDASPTDAYTPLYSLLAQRYGKSKDQAASKLTIRSLDIHCDWMGEMTFNFGTLEHDYSLSVSSEWRYDLPPQILFSLEINDYEDLVCQACRSIPIANVQSLDITCPPPFLAFWTEVLGCCRNLRYMKLSNGAMPPYMASLLSATPPNCTENQDERADRDASHTLAPTLEELELHNTWFPTGVGRDTDPVEVINIRSICDALSTRKGSRGRLIVTRCIERISDDRVKKFNMEGTWGDGHFCTDFYRGLLYRVRFRTS